MANVFSNIPRNVKRVVLFRALNRDYMDFGRFMDVVSFLESLGVSLSDLHPYLAPTMPLPAPASRIRGRRSYGKAFLSL